MGEQQATRTSQEGMSDATAAYSIRAWGGRTLEQTEWKTLSHLGILMPLCLSPILYKGTMSSRCLYCILMPLFLWAFNSLPVPLVAFLHVVNLPLFGIVAPDQLAAEYLQVDGIRVVLLSLLVTSVDTGTNFIPRVVYKLAKDHGLRRRKLFFVLCTGTFLCAMLCPQTVVAVPLLLFVDRVVCTVYHENLDSSSAPRVRVNVHGGHKVHQYGTPSSSRSAQSPDNDVLIDKLAQVVDAMVDEQKVQSDTISKSASKEGRKLLGDSEYSDEDVRENVREEKSRSRPSVGRASSQDVFPKHVMLEPEDTSTLRTGGEKSEDTSRRVIQIRTPDETPGGATSSTIKTKSYPRFADIDAEATSSTIKTKSCPRFADLDAEAVTGELDSEIVRSLSGKDGGQPSAIEIITTGHDTTAEAAPTRGASILKVPGSAAASRRASSAVDFKESLPNSQRNTALEWEDRQVGRSLSERRRSLRSRGSITSEGGDSMTEWARWNSRKYARRISMRFPMGKDTASEDWHGRSAGTRHVSTTGGAASTSQNEKAVEAARDSITRRRADMHNAFMLAPSLITVFGSISSLGFVPADDALDSIRQDPQMARITVLRWWSLTLPGSLLASVVSCVYIYLYFQLARHEPENPDHQKIIVETARKKLEKLGPASIADHLGHYYVGIFCLLYYPFVFLGHSATDVQLYILTGMVLASAVLSPFFKHSLLARNSIGLKMPWGVLFILGAAQIISATVEANNLIEEMFRGIQPAVWQGYTPVTVQTILASISAALAEAMDRHTLSRLMMPIVNDVAATTGMYPMYYAIPVVVGAATNTIMPISVPLVILHEIAHVPMWKLLLMGILLKTLLVGCVVVSMNTTSQAFSSWGEPYTVHE